MKNRHFTRFVTVVMTLTLMLSLSITSVSAAVYQNTQKKADPSKPKAVVIYAIKSDTKDFYKKGNYTYVTSTATWSWSTAPDKMKTDVIALTNGQGFIVDQFANCKKNLCLPTNVASCKVTYVVHPSQSVDSSKAYAPKTISYTVNTTKAGNGAYVNIPMQKTYKIKGRNVTFYAKSGTTSVRWIKSGNVKLVSLATNYGHAANIPKPDVSIKNSGAGISIGFSKKTIYGKEAYISLKRK